MILSIPIQFLMLIVLFIKTRANNHQMRNLQVCSKMMHCNPFFPLLAIHLESFILFFFSSNANRTQTHNLVVDTEHLPCATSSHFSPSPDLLIALGKGRALALTTADRFLSYQLLSQYYKPFITGLFTSYLYEGTISNFYTLTSGWA